MTTSTPIDLETLSSLLAGIDIDNVFNESQLPTRSTRPSRRPPLQPSLSLPLQSVYHSDLTTTGSSETAFLPMRLPAPKSAERRTQSIGEASTLYQAAVGQDVTKQGSVAAPTRYKTELCRPFEENGTCRYGSKCQFAHGKAELRSVVRHPKYKTDLCRTFHTTGLCPYGPRCHFIHNDDERRTGDPSNQLVPSTQEMLGRREDGPRALYRQYSDVRVPGSSRVGRSPGAELHRRASSVADAVIRNSVPYQHQLLQTVPESTMDLYSTALNISTTTNSLGSSSASSITDSPSPSPTGGLLLPAVEEPAKPTPTTRQAPPAPAGLTGDDERARAVLLAELVARLGPQDVATLIRALQLPGVTPARNSGGESFDGVNTTENIWSQYQQHCQQQQQHGPAASNVCW